MIRYTEKNPDLELGRFGNSSYMKSSPNRNEKSKESIHRLTKPIYLNHASNQFEITIRFIKVIKVLGGLGYQDSKIITPVHLKNKLEEIITQASLVNLAYSNKFSFELER